MIAYKVCFTGRGNVLSFTICGEPSSLVEYFVGKWVGRNKGHGPLAAFRTLESAKAFLHREAARSKQYYTIFECDVVESKQTRLWEKTSFGINYFRPWFSGTIYCNKIKLLRKIEP